MNIQQIVFHGHCLDYCARVQYEKIIFEYNEMLPRILREVLRFKRVIFLETAINHTTLCFEIAAIETRSNYCRVDL
jgi:hypothetical protein